MLTDSFTIRQPYNCQPCKTVNTYHIHHPHVCLYICMCLCRCMLLHFVDTLQSNEAYDSWFVFSLLWHFSQQPSTYECVEKKQSSTALLIRPGRQKQSEIRINKSWQSYPYALHTEIVEGFNIFTWSTPCWAAGTVKAKEVLETQRKNIYQKQCKWNDASVLFSYSSCMVVSNFLLRRLLEPSKWLLIANHTPYLFVSAPGSDHN